jgi:SAM-dependent methyltransferase
VIVEGRVSLKSTGQSLDYEDPRARDGDPGYLRSTQEWRGFSQRIADAIVQCLRPRKVFDAGCGSGFLAEMLWDRGVEIRGRDISEQAMAGMRPDVRCWCELGSITDPIEGQYDLMLCVNVLEYMTKKDASAAIHNITNNAPRVLFSSSPTTSGAVNAINVKPVGYWLERFAEANFAPVGGFDPTFLYPHAILFEWSDEGRDDASRTAFMEIVRQRQIFAEARELEATNRIQLQHNVAKFKQTETQSPFAPRIQARWLCSNDTTVGGRDIGPETEIGRGVRSTQHVAARTPLLRRTADALSRIAGMPLPSRRRKRRAQRSMVAEVQTTELFDAAFYLSNNPDVAASRVNPALHFVTRGWKEGRKPSAGFDPAFYLARYRDVAAAGTNPLLHYLRSGRAERRQRLPGPNDPLQPILDTSARTSQSILQRQNAAWAPLPIFVDQRAPPTLTVLTDSVDPDRLFGDVATAMVVGVFVARRLKARLRLVTRDLAPDPGALGGILRAHRIDWDGQTDFVHLPSGDQRPVPLGDEDLVLATSWRTARAALGSVNPARVLYLMQEDERMFYPHGDLRLRCSELLSEPCLRVLVSTRQLFDHLANSSEPLPHIRKHGLWFNPALPPFPRPNAPQPPTSGRQNFFFFAWPNNDRTPHWRGLEALHAAMKEGVLASDQWNIHFVGRELPDLELPGGVRPWVWPRLTWSEYVDLVSIMDLGLCPMDTPHASYPPLDLAASGAVVVTNKKSFEQWSRNIIAAPSSVSALTDALRDGVKLSRNREQRFANCATDKIPREWEPELGPVIERLLGGRA